LNQNSLRTAFKRILYVRGLELFRGSCRRRKSRTRCCLHSFLLYVISPFPGT